MSDFSLTLALQIKTSKIINDIAKVQQRSEKITAFGGTFFVLDKFDSILSSVIDSLYIRAICTFSGREYKYAPAQRVDTVIYHDEKKFMTSRSSKLKRGRRILSYLTSIFENIP